MKLAFQQHGKGTPIILLHAFPLSNEMWKAQIDLLVENGFYVILPDLPGFGDSLSNSDTTTMEEMAESVANLLESLKIEKAVIGGLSMGGYVTLNLYRLYPEKFSAMILCDTSQKADTQEKRDGRFELIKNVEEKGLSFVAENVIPNLIAENSKDDLLESLQKKTLNADEKGVKAALRGMAARKDHTETLKEIDIPALLIFGEFDDVTSVENAKSMNEMISNSKLEIIENAGHLSNLEQPDDFNKSLITFLKEL